jgi:hypothetical protein
MLGQQGKGIKRGRFRPDGKNVISIQQTAILSLIIKITGVNAIKSGILNIYA